MCTTVGSTLSGAPLARSASLKSDRVVLRVAGKGTIKFTVV